MNILAIDTASRYLSLALCIDNNTVETVKLVENKHSDSVLPEIERLLVRANSNISQINYIAYNQGPGSFTGLRIGLSAALGLAFGINAKLIPVPAFALHAKAYYDESKSNAKEVLVGLDARLGDIYLAGLVMPDLEYSIPPQIIKSEDCIYDIKDRAGDWFLRDSIYPGARYLLNLALSGRYKPVAPEDADLLYLRNKVALDLNEQRQAKHI